MSSPALFPDEIASNSGDASSNMADATVARSEHSAKIRRSALWAAYGDALGWISELTDEAGLNRRTAGEPLCRPLRWTRRIGGRGGIMASLPVGCYSDDTQLRLASGRAIRPDGFDVEVFARVELPVWLSYALGGGKGTSAAANNLVKSKVPWFANTFNGWTESGGNGAAMRIQPHVWAAHAPKNPERFLPDVVRNTVCTHSHPTGIMGAVLHALSLAHTISTGCSPSPDDLDAAITTASNLPALMEGDFEVWNYWRTAFEREAGPFSEAWERAITDSKHALRIAGTNPSNLTGAERYSAMVDNLMLRKREHIGSGILTAVAAVGLIWCEAQPEEALRIAANEIGTDTDTIATMAGAILGVTAETEPPVEVLDAALFRSEADRLSKIAQDGRPQGHQYPDLLHWSAPKTRSDALTRARDGSLHVSGLGFAEAQGEPLTAPKGDFMWQWLRLESGQTILLKRRNVLAYREIDALNRETQPDAQVQLTDGTTLQVELKQVQETSSRPINLDGALKYIAEHKSDDKYIGVALRGVVTRGTTGQIAAFTSALIDLLRETDELKTTEQPPK